MTRSESRSYRAYTRKDLEFIGERHGLSSDDVLAMKALSAVLPFRVNNYVLDELIRWEDGETDPMFQLTFPQRGMLASDDFERMLALVKRDAPDAELKQAASAIHLKMNPHPGGQMALNVPNLDGEPLPGMQHKYRETVLFFPSHGQTCHAYCTYCFRWAQFVGAEELKFAARQAETLVRYLKQTPGVTDVLFTGGDPLIMKTRHLAGYVDPLLDSGLDEITSIRIGTKAPAYWPDRFLGDADADDLLRLFERVVASGRNLALMAHFSHPRELETESVQKAMRRIVTTGATVRCQAPVVRRVNDNAAAWAEMWRAQVRLGAMPYYMFVERDTGPKAYFEVPLARAHEIFSEAYRSVSGLARTARGPSMSATPGKVLVDGVVEFGGQKMFALRFIQSRNPDWTGQPFFARFDPLVTWFDGLEPAMGQERFFFDPPHVDRRPVGERRVLASSIAR